MKNKNLLVIPVIFVLGLLLAACGSKAESGPGEILVKVKNEFTYDPSTITVKAGEEVKITFENTGSVEHTFNILKADAELEHIMEEMPSEEHLHEELLMDMHETAPGASNSATFTAPTEVGDYNIVCTLPGHIQAGMVATLRVTP